MSAWFQNTLKGRSQLLRESILTLITLVSQLHFLLGLPIFSLPYFRKGFFLYVFSCMSVSIYREKGEGFFSPDRHWIFCLHGLAFWHFTAVYLFLVLLTSILQNEVRITLSVKKPKPYLFHVILRYINPGTAIVSGHITAYQSRTLKGR